MKREKAQPKKLKKLSSSQQLIPASFSRQNKENLIKFLFAKKRRLAFFGTKKHEKNNKQRKCIVDKSERNEIFLFHSLWFFEITV